MDLLLKKLEGYENRNAQFKTIISLYWEGEYYEFEGIVTGKILKERKGIKGFGYDPIFQPDEADCSFAEMELGEKNKISHRARAIEKMLKFIKNY